MQMVNQFLVISYNIRPRQQPSHSLGFATRALLKKAFCHKIYIETYSPGPLFRPSNKTSYYQILLTHGGRVTHKCVSKLSFLGSDNGLSPGRRQAIIWTNAGILLSGTWGTNFSKILIKVHTFPFKKMHLKCRLQNGGNIVSASMC